MRRFILALFITLPLVVGSAGAPVQAGDAAPVNSGNTSIQLEVDIIPPSPPTPSGGDGNGEGGGEGIIYGIETNLFGVEKKYYTSYEGGISKTVEATSEDGNLTVTLPKGTILEDEKGKQLKTLEVLIDKDPPSPPEGANIIGLPYSFEPSGATFEPPITFTWSYDPNALPEGVAEVNLVLAYYIDGEWIELECVVDTETNTITAGVSHFTTFAIIGTKTITPEPTIPEPIVPVEPEPVEPVVVEPTPEPTPAPPVVTPPAPAPEPSEPTIPIEPTETNWLLIYTIILSSIFVVGLVVGLIIRKRRHSS